MNTFPLTNYQRLRITGPDALAFAHSQFANDVLSLKIDYWQWNCYLNPQGRVLALFLLVRLSEHELILILPYGRAAEIQANLIRYRFRSRCELTVDRDAQILGQYSNPVEPEITASLELHTQGKTKRVDSLIEIKIGGCTQRSILLNLDLDETKNEAHDFYIHTQKWLYSDIIDAIPWLSSEVSESYTPQALSLDRLEAYSVSKGCYPGQEIVARTHFLGKNKRHLMHFEVDKPLSLNTGEALYVNPDQNTETVAEVIACYRGQHHSSGLVVSKNQTLTNAYLKNEKGMAIQLNAIPFLTHK
jgi:folate-binding protein YgfZ